MWEAGRSWPVMWRGVPSCRGGDQEGACCFLTLGGLYQWRVGCTHEGIESGLSGSGDRFCVWGGRGREGGTTGGCRWCVGRLGTGVWGGAAGGELPPRLPAGAFPLFYFFSLAWLLPRDPPPLRITRTPLSLCPFPLSSAGSGGIGWCQGVKRCGRWGRQSAPFPAPSPPFPLLFQQAGPPAPCLIALSGETLRRRGQPTRQLVGGRGKAGEASCPPPLLLSPPPPPQPPSRPAAPSASSHQR